MNNITTFDHKEAAISHFSQHHYEEALFHYGLAKEGAPEDPDIEIGILLTSLAQEMEEEAHALFEFYNVAKTSEELEAVELVKTLIDSVEQGLSGSEEIGNDAIRPVVSLEEELEYENGIAYRDFKTIVSNSKNFSEAFRKVIFSTKVIISHKQDFFEFVENLIDNGYIDMALGYIDSANRIFPSDQKIRDLLNKISRLDRVEATDK